MRKILLLLALFAALFSSVYAQKEYKYQSFKNDPLGTRIYKLDNGLTVYMSVNKNEPRIVTRIAVKAGSKNDPADATGLAHYLEHMLFKGTKNRTARQIADDMARIGGDINDYTSKECTSFYAVTLDQGLKC